MRNLIVLFTLLLMSSSAFAMTYYLTGQSYNRSTGIRTCYYTGGHIRTKSNGYSCSSRITQ